MKRWLISLPLVLLAGLMLLLAAGWWAVHDRDGSAWLLRQGARLIPGELVFELRDGSLATGLAFASVAYQDTGLSLQARELEIALAWRELATSRLRIEHLRAAELGVTVAGATDKVQQPTPPPDVILPIEIALDSLTIGRLDLDVAGFADELRDIRLSARHSAAGLDIRELVLSGRGLQLRIAGRLQTSGQWPMRLRTALQLPAAGIDSEGELAGDLRRLRIEQRLRLPDPVVLRGELTQLLSDPRAELSASWEAVALPLAALDGWRLGSGSLHLDGGLEDWQAELDSELRPPSLAAGHLAATIRGDLQRLQLPRLEVEWDRAVITGSGELRLPTLAAELQFTASGVDLELLAPELRGSVDLSGRVGVEPAKSFTAVIDSLDGRLFDRQLSGRARLNWQPGEWQLAALDLQAGDNRLSFSGELGDRLSGKGRLDASALEQLWPGLAGRVAGQFVLAGQANRPSISLKLDGRELRWQSWQLASVALAGSLQNDVLAIDLQGDDLALGDNSLGRLILAADGPRDDFKLSLTMLDGPAELELDGVGAWQQARLLLTFNSGELASQATGQWALDRPLNIDATAARLGLGAHCWRNGEAEVCLEDSVLAPDSQELGGRARTLPLSLLRPMLPPGLRLTGTADAEFRWQRDSAATAIQLVWQQSESRLSYRAESGETLETRIRRIDLRAAGDGRQLSLTGEALGEQNLELHLAGRVSEPFSTAMLLALSLDVRLPELGAVEALARRFLPVRDLRGQLAGRLEIGGSLQVPQFSGELSLSNGAAAIPDAGIDVEQIDLQLVGRDDEPLELTGRAVSGGGHLLLKGFIDWSQNTALYADLKISGSDFQAFRFPDQSISISPDIRALVDGGRIVVTGELTVPRAAIRLEELPENAAKPSDDVVIHAAGVARRRPREQLELVGTLRVVLGEEVYFSGFGLDTRLAGELLLTKPPAGLPPVAQGQLRTEGGRFKAAGKDLEVERGLLIFAGPINRPTLDVRAVRHTSWEGEDITVGILLSGPSDAIKTRVFAEPAMSEADALAFLVLDRPLSAVQTGGSAELSNSALAFGLLRVLPITQQLEQGLGLDEVGVEGSGGENTSVVAGKRIGRNLFVRYRYGLFNRIGTFLVRYRIGRGFSIEAGSGEQQSLELIYSIDR